MRGLFLWWGSNSLVLELGKRADWIDEKVMFTFDRKGCRQEGNGV
jgi:hypothetical protein